MEVVDIDKLEAVVLVLVLAIREFNYLCMRRGFPHVPNVSLSGILRTSIVAFKKWIGFYSLPLQE